MKVLCPRRTEMEKTFKMLCPYCKRIFEITERQKGGNSTFRCPHCKTHNQGSTYTINKVLIGEK